MMTTFDMQLVRNTCEQFDIPISQAILDAEALVLAAESALETHKRLAAPDLANATAKNLGELITASADHDAQAARVVAAQAAVDQMRARRADAWQQARHSIVEGMRKPFDDAAAQFMQAAAELTPATTDGSSWTEKSWYVDPTRVLALGLSEPYTRYATAAAIMKDLAENRDRLDSGQGRLDVGVMESRYGYERASRFATFATRTAALRVQALGGDVHEPRWWLALARIPGVTLRWRHDHERDIRVQSLPVGA